MIVKKKNTGEFSSLADRAFWAHCEAVAAEVGLWPKWMRGEVETPPPRFLDRLCLTRSVAPPPSRRRAAARKRR
jgi:hypothetical protein